MDNIYIYINYFAFAVDPFWDWIGIDPFLLCFSAQCFWPHQQYAVLHVRKVHIRRTSWSSGTLGVMPLGNIYIYIHTYIVCGYIYCMYNIYDQYYTYIYIYIYIFIYLYIPCWLLPIGYSLLAVPYWGSIGHIRRTLQPSGMLGVMQGFSKE